MKLPVSEVWLIFLWSLSVKELNERKSVWLTEITFGSYLKLFWRYLNVIICTDHVSRCMKGGQLTPSLMNIKGTQIKLHLQLSSLNFLIPSPSICLGINKILNYYVLINYIVVMMNGITVYYDVMFKLLLS